MTPKNNDRPVIKVHQTTNTPPHPLFVRCYLYLALHFSHKYFYKTAPTAIYTYPFISLFFSFIFKKKKKTFNFLFQHFFSLCLIFIISHEYSQFVPTHTYVDASVLYYFQSQIKKKLLSQPDTHNWSFFLLFFSYWIFHGNYSSVVWVR